MNNVNSLWCNTLNLAPNTHSPNQKYLVNRSIPIAAKKEEMVVNLSYFEGRNTNAVSF